MKLTAKTASTLALPAGKADIIHFDDAWPGSGLRLRRAADGKGLRSWIAQYRVHGGRDASCSATPTC